MTMNNKEYYECEILTSKDYRITLKDFISWISETDNRKKEFENFLNREDNYTIAVDYSIPMIMVKYFKRFGI